MQLTTSFNLIRMRPVLSGLHTPNSMLAKPCWETQIGVCEHSTMRPVFSGLHTPNSMLANPCWETQIGVCEQHNNMLASCWRKVVENRDKFYLSPTVCQHVVVSFTHAILSLPTLVWRVKAALRILKRPSHVKLMLAWPTRVGKLKLPCVWTTQQHLGKLLGKNKCKEDHPSY